LSHREAKRLSIGGWKAYRGDDAQVASWGAESTTRSVTSTAYLNQVTPTGGEMWATIQASNWFVDDANFDVGHFVVPEAVRQFVAAEAQAMGLNCKPGGSILNRHK
jgi:HK97 family phage major capsid protein